MSIDITGHALHDFHYHLQSDVVPPRTRHDVRRNAHIRLSIRHELQLEGKDSSYPSDDPSCLEGQGTASIPPIPPSQPLSIDNRNEFGNSSYRFTGRIKRFREPEPDSDISAGPVNTLNLKAGPAIIKTSGAFFMEAGCLPTPTVVEVAKEQHASTIKGKKANTVRRAATISSVPPRRSARIGGKADSSAHILPVKRKREEEEEVPPVTEEGLVEEDSYRIIKPMPKKRKQSTATNDL